jgi:hypothetical protein
MSMGVDLSSALTAEERAYLAERGRYADIDRVDALHGVTDAPDLGSGDGTGPQMVPLMTGEQRAGEAARLRARLAELEAEDTEDSDEETAEPYEAWKVDELKAEIDRRNVGRATEAQLPKGTKAQMVDTLYDDDQPPVES